MIKNIIQFSPFPFEHAGGVEKYCHILHHIFTENPEKNPDFSFQTIEPGKDFRIFEPVSNCPFPNFFDKNFWKIFTNISTKNTNILISHIRFSPITFFVFLLAKAKKIPYIHIEHGSDHLFHTNFFIQKIAKIIDYTIGKYILKNADFVITISKAWENWVKNFANRNEKILTIYRGFDIPQKIPQKIPKNPIKIGFVGRLIPFKNLEILLFSLKNLKHLPWKCTIVGNGEMRWKWEKLTKKLELSDKIEFLGEKSHSWILENFYPNIDIFINPSRQEWLPTTVIEALLAGVRVIATDVGGTREIPDISLCEANIASLTKTLHKKIQETAKSQELSQEFYEKFSLAKMHTNFLKIFRKL